MLNELFDCIFVINLAHRNDRRVEMEGELNRIGLSLLDGSAEILPASKFTDAGGFDSTGARGCFDSHLRALKTAYERKSNGVLIFEDDCDFAQNIREKLPEVLRQLANTEWSIFYGGHLSEVTPCGSIGGISKIAPEQGLCGAHFIAVSGEALPILIQYLEAMLAREPGSPLGGPMHVDGAYSWFRNDHPACETWIADPQLGFQRPSRTDIHQLKFYDQIIGLRQSVAFARRIKRKFL
jgi:glycosyl transferase family 25